MPVPVVSPMRHAHDSYGSGFEGRADCFGTIRNRPGRWGCIRERHSIIR